MKSDHRHELKSNELADWLANLPEWLKENQKNLLTVAAVVVVALVMTAYVMLDRRTSKWMPR